MSGAGATIFLIALFLAVVGITVVVVVARRGGIPVEPPDQETKPDS